MHVRLTATLVLALAGLSAGAMAAPSHHRVPLQAGTYILDGAGKRCADVPNAGTLYFDGKNLIGPHDHDVSTSIKSVSPDGQTYTVRSTSTSYDMHGKPMQDARLQILQLRGKASFRVIDRKTGKPESAFHRCGPMPKKSRR